MVVHGGDDAAVAGAVDLDSRALPRSVMLLHRRDVFQAAPDACWPNCRHLREAGRIQVVDAARSRAWRPRRRRLQALALADPARHHRAAAAGPAAGRTWASPPAWGRFADWGLTMDRKQLAVDTATFATSVPGIYAVGDINTYPGKRKLIVCGFHEATLAAFAAAEALSDKPVLLQYTTCSSQLQQSLRGGPSAA